MNPEDFDENKQYCRMLGHEVAFSYCRVLKQKLPCHRIEDCWFESLPVEKYIETCFSAEEQLKIFAPPQPKIASLVDMINQAKRHMGGPST